MIGSNNYVGLTNHPKVKEAAIEAVRKYGTSCTGSRFLNGTLDLHHRARGAAGPVHRHGGRPRLQHRLPGQPGPIPAIMDKDDIIITDREVHASIIDGVRMAKILKNIQICTYKHNDPADLEAVLSSLPAEPAKLVIVDGVFSMGGDIAKLPELIPICRKYGARFMSDDAHALGVLGGGRGTGWHFGHAEGRRPGHGHVQQVLGLGRRLHRRPQGGRPLHPDLRPAVHVQRQPAAVQRGHGPGLPGCPRERSPSASSGSTRSPRGSGPSSGAWATTSARPRRPSSPSSSAT